MTEDRPRPLADRTSLRLTPYAAAMAPRVSPETTVWTFPAAAAGAAAGAAAVACTLACSVVSGAVTPAWAGAPTPNAMPDAAATASAGRPRERACDLAVTARPSSTMERAGVARWRAEMEFFDTVDRLSHACGVSCRIRAGDARPEAAPRWTEALFDLTPRPHVAVETWFPRPCQLERLDPMISGRARHTDGNVPTERDTRRP